MIKSNRMECHMDGVAALLAHVPEHFVDRLVAILQTRLHFNLKFGKIYHMKLFTFRAVLTILIKTDGTGDLKWG